MQDPMRTVTVFPDHTPERWYTGLGFYALLGALTAILALFL